MKNLLFGVLFTLVMGAVYSTSIALTTPVITSITNSIDSIDEVITITGVGLNFSSTLPGYGSDNPSQNVLRCNEYLQSSSGELVILSWTDTEVKFKFKDEDTISFHGNKNTYKCYITFQGFYAPGESTDTNYNSNSVSITIKPIIKSVDYGYGKESAKPGEKITLNGFLFGNSTGSVTINGIFAKIENYYGWSNKQVVVEVPDTSSGNVKLTTTEGVSSNQYSITTTPLKPSCTLNDWSCTSWSSCSSSGTQTRSCNKISNCEGGSPAPTTSQYCTYIPPVCTSWIYTAWSSCSANGQQTRSILSSSPSGCTGGSPVLTQSCTPTPPVCISWIYTSWSACSSDGKQTRSILSSSPTGCTGGSPTLTQSCTPILTPTIISVFPATVYQGDTIAIQGKNFGKYGDYGISCSQCKVLLNGISLSLYKGYGYPGEKWTDTAITLTLPENTTSGALKVIDKNGKQSNTFQITITPLTPSCTSNDWSCTSWGSCSSSGKQTRTCNKKTTCEGGVSSPSTSQYCTYIPPCTEDFWECSAWGQCNANNQKTRTCAKTYDCSTANTPSPDTTQACNYIPPCNADKWECGSWGTCSPQGIQSRSCNRTYDCPSAETAAPTTAQYCQPPSNPTYQSPADTKNITNQESIIKATVKLKCPVTSTRGWAGSGTVIDSMGIILTNKHVITDTAGCYVGFVDSYKDVPYFGNKQIADIYKVSTNEDIALLKLRNPNNKKLPLVDISQGNNNSLKPTDKLVIYGYPGIGGDTITVTAGYYNGVSGNFLKTDALIAHGNSGGGAYTTNGIFMGIPTGAIPDDITHLGYVLSINRINSWLNNTPIAYAPPNTNNYSRVASILENMTVDQINQLQLYVPGTEPTDSSQENKDEASSVVQQIKLIKSSDNPTVFEIKDNQRRQIKSAREFLALGYKWSDIVELSPSEVKAYPLGDPVTVEIKLLKLIDNPTVYEVINYGQAKPFTSAQEFLGKGYKWSEIKIVDQSELSKYLNSDTAKETSQTIEINTKALNLRAGPSAQDRKLGITYQGEKYAVLESQNGWHKIEKNGLSGWVYGGYVK